MKKYSKLSTKRYDSKWLFNQSKKTLCNIIFELVGDDFLMPPKEIYLKNLKRTHIKYIVNQIQYFQSCQELDNLMDKKML